VGKPELYIEDHIYEEDDNDLTFSEKPQFENTGTSSLVVIGSTKYARDSATSGRSSILRAKGQRNEDEHDAPKSPSFAIAPKLKKNRKKWDILYHENKEIRERKLR
jgi:hypothetical protein